MPGLAIRAYLQLVFVDLLLQFRDFPALCRWVSETETVKAKARGCTTDHICRAVDLACVWYWKQVPCLQRSAVTTRLLRNHGIAACLVIGAQTLPFRAHAWVEAGGQVVNDKPYVSEMYAVLDRW